MTIRTQRDMDNAWLAGQMKFDDWKQLYDAEQTAEQRGMMLKIVAKQPGYAGRVTVLQGDMPQA